MGCSTDSSKYGTHIERPEHQHHIYEYPQYTNIYHKFTSQQQTDIIMCVTTRAAFTQAHPHLTYCSLDLFLCILLNQK